MQNRELNQINQFDVLVHPYFVDATDRMGLIQTQPYQELVSAWQHRLKKINQRSDAMLIYYSSFEDPVSDFGSYEEYRQGWPEQELLRISGLQSQLGSRVVIFKEGIQLPKRAPLVNKLHDLGYSWNPDTARMSAYGEYMDICVKNWGEEVKTFLGIKSKNYRGRIPALCQTDLRTREMYRQVRGTL